MWESVQQKLDHTNPKSMFHVDNYLVKKLSHDEDKIINNNIRHLEVMSPNYIITIVDCEF